MTLSSSHYDSEVILDPRIEETMEKMNKCARIYDSMTYDEFADPRRYFGSSPEESESRIMRIFRGTGFKKSIVNKALAFLTRTNPAGIVTINTFILENLALNPDSDYYKDVVRPEIENPEHIEPALYSFLNNVSQSEKVNMWARAELMTSLSKYSLQTEDGLNLGKFNSGSPKLKMQVETPYDSIEKITGRTSYTLFYHKLPMTTEYE